MDESQDTELSECCQEARERCVRVLVQMEQEALWQSRQDREGRKYLEAGIEWEKAAVLKAAIRRIYERC